jgi:hypothetical protein
VALFAAAAAISCILNSKKLYLLFRLFALLNKLKYQGDIAYLRKTQRKALDFCVAATGNQVEFIQPNDPHKCVMDLKI